MRNKSIEIDVLMTMNSLMIGFSHCASVRHVCYSNDTINKKETICFAQHVELNFP